MRFAGVIFALLFGFSLSTLAFGEDTREIEGVVVGTFPSNIEVIAEGGSLEIYKYAPMGGSKSFITIYVQKDSTYISIAGNARSKCLPNELGKLANDIEFTYKADNSKEKQKMTIPKGVTVSSTCPQGQSNASDLGFSVPK
jgi:hypothetical protein